MDSATATTIAPARAFRQELVRRGVGETARCYQCATCSAVCDLATAGTARVRAALAVEAVLAQVGVRRLLLTPPPLPVAADDARVGEPARALERDPAHRDRLRVLPRRLAVLPDA